MSGATSPKILLERLRTAADASDWEQVRRLCHPEARLVLRMSEGVALTLDDAIDRLRTDELDGEHEPTHYYIDDIDECAVLSLGSVTRNGETAHLCWLLTFVDDLAYRQALFASMSDAQAAYAELGVDLGYPGRSAVVDPA